MIANWRGVSMEHLAGLLLTRHMIGGRDRSA
jgi:hypothetical protein